MARDALPPELVDLAMDRLLGAERADRAVICEQLVAAHPRHADSLRRMLVQVNGAERLLDRSYPALDDAPALDGYRVVRRLGQGAFGTVYLCEQTEPVAREVAVKVLRPGVGDQHTLARFAAERQLLASLSHPAITHVYDAGCAADGRPFFVMEYVDGVPIAAHCERAALTAEQCLRLFVEVCRGVDHAHGRGVVHRDLKPANILVVNGADGPLPKIIDFGIAKSLGPRPLAAGEPMTGTGHVLGTPGYMSPEQASGAGDRVDARADVFALGVVLFELLTGELPWPRDRAAPDGATPVLPSERLATRARAAPAAAATAMRRRAALVRGDLDWIVRKATQTDPADRYLRARDLAEDVERHLAGLPVHAGPPTLRYRVRKFLRRHRTIAAAGLLATLVGGGGLALAAWRADADAALHYTEANRLADQLLQRANAVDTRQAPQSEGVRAALARDALSFYETWLRDRPHDPVLRTGRCNALMTLSRVHYALGQLVEALATAELATDEATALRDADGTAQPGPRATLAEASRLRGRALQLAQQPRAAGPWLQQAVAELAALAAQAPAAHGLSHAAALREWAGNELMLGAHETALAANTLAITALEDLVARGITAAEARSDLVMARVALAMCQTALGRHDAAAASLDAAADGLPDVVVDRHRATAVVHAQRGRSAAERGDDDTALAALTLAAAASERWRDAEPRQFQAFTTQLEAHRALAALHERRGEWPAADAALARTLQVREAMVGAFPQRAAQRTELEAGWYDAARTVWNRYRRQDLPPARAWVERLLASKRDRAPAAAPDATVRPFLWECLALQASLAESDGDDTTVAWERVAAELAAAGSPTDPKAAPMALEAWLGVARAQLRRGDVAGARATLARTAPLLDAPGLDDDFRLQHALAHAQLCLAERDVDGAMPHVARVLELRSTWSGRRHAGDCERVAADVLAASGGAAERVAAHRAAAAAHYRAAIDALAPRVAAAPDDPWLVAPFALAQLGCAELHAAAGETTSALALLDAASAAFARIAATAPRDVLTAERVAAAHALRAELARASR